MSWDAARAQRRGERLRTLRLAMGAVMALPVIWLLLAFFLAAIG